METRKLKSYEFSTRFNRIHSIKILLNFHTSHCDCSDTTQNQLILTPYVIIFDVSSLNTSDRCSTQLKIKWIAFKKLNTKFRIIQ